MSTITEKQIFKNNIFKKRKKEKRSESRESRGPRAGVENPEAPVPGPYKAR